MWGWIISVGLIAIIAAVVAWIVSGMRTASVLKGARRKEQG